ncbi:hypothetical protein KKG45_12935 [bacterium]|nr:hypothetical protein [bacterium]MBU1074145.1 hypothetical protein [bacterium]MBU1676424.1 hypothetical protein [bacterium]
MKTCTLIMICVLAMATCGWSQEWYLNVYDEFDRGDLGDDWTGWVVPGDPCGYVSVGGDQLTFKSQCGCGYDSPAPTDVQYGLELPDDYRIVVRLDKAETCGWTKVLLSEDAGVFPPTRVLGLFLNGNGVGGGYGSVSLRMYLDGVPTGLDGTEYAFGIGVWNVWVLTKEGAHLTLEVGPTEEALSPLLEATEATLFGGGYLTLEGSQAGVLTHVDYVKIYSHSPVSADEMSWGGIKRVFER